MHRLLNKQQILVYSIQVVLESFDCSLKLRLNIKVENEDIYTDLCMKISCSHSFIMKLIINTYDWFTSRSTNQDFLQSTFMRTITVNDISIAAISIHNLNLEFGGLYEHLLTVSSDTGSNLIGPTSAMEQICSYFG